MVDPEAINYFSYLPVRGLPEAMIGLFMALGIILVVQILNTSAPKWMYVLTGAAVGESIGYIMRTVCLYQPSLGSFIVMDIFLLLPPNALALFNYMCVREVTKRTKKQNLQAFLQPSFIAWVYNTSDIVGFVLQMVGCGMEPAQTTRKAGQIVVLIGLGIQTLFLGAFLVTVMYVWRDPEMTVVRAPGDQTPEVAKTRLMQVLTVTTVLLYVRLVYRIINYANGFGGAIYRHEWALYAFDSLMVFVCFVIYVVRFVGHYFPASGWTAEEAVFRSA